MMGLLHKLVPKISKVLKNHKTLTFNQRKLAVSYNVDHPDYPIKVGLVSGSDSDVEPEGEEAFDVPAPQFQEDPHFEDKDAGVGGAAGGGDSGEDEDDDDDKSDGDEVREMQVETERK